MARPSKYKNIDLKQVEVLGQFGLTDIEISKALGVCEKTLNNYKKKYPEFLQSLNRGKQYADENVVRSLYAKANGYSHPDVHITNYLGEVKLTNTIKHYPPDTTACIFWLKNRQPDKWRDKQEIDQNNINTELTKDLTKEERAELKDRLLKKLLNDG